MKKITKKFFLFQLFILVCVCSLTILKYFDFKRSVVKKDVNINLNQEFKVPEIQDVQALTAKLNGKAWGFSTTKRFKIPNVFWKPIIDHFSGINKPLFAKKKKITLPQDSILGIIEFDLRSGRKLEIAFFDAGKGAIGFIYNSNLYVSRFCDDDGALSLLVLLEQVYQTSAEKGVNAAP